MAGPRDYRTFGERDAQLFRDLIEGSRSTSRPVSPSASPSGIMAPRGVNMEEEARRSAEEAAAIRSGMGITESLRGPLNIEDSIVGQVARSMGANADDPESVATAVTTVNTDVPRANAGIQAYADMRPVEETLALGAGDQTLAALGRPDPLDMPDREGTTQGFTPDVPEPVLSIHTVQSGDLLTTIARRNNITLQALLQANPDITDPDTIAIGQEINIPSSDDNEDTEQVDTPVTETSVAATEGQPVSQQEGNTPEFSIPSNIDFSFIAEQEGDESSMYVPMSNGRAMDSSGPTIGMGVDLGQKSPEELEGLPEDLRRRLEPYTNLRGQAAVNFVRNNPLTLTDEERQTINAWSKQEETNRLIALWERDSNIPWEELTTQQATAVASVMYQYGSYRVRTPNFWRAATSGDWGSVESELRNFGDRYGPRRLREANYLSGN